ncbi:MAG: hypothetical protein QG621_425, partial [Patescibacteria group bacterium]|nr:hypothetical protein [Patescibacteria group bacterium]
MRSFAEWAHRISPEPTEFNASAAKNGLSDKYYERLHALKPGEILIPLNSLKKPGLFTVVNEAALLVVGDRSVKPHDGTRGLIYAATTGRRSTDGPFRNRTILLHRLLVFGFEGFETAKPFVVHHKDGNTLNNVWDNLQITTQTYNQEVAERVAGNSGFKGVRFETKRTLSRPHRVEIVVGNFKFDQRFSCPIEAAVVHDETLI